ncbi:unnamed protein product [Ambrosiozyma monospora]|uniref:Unnamed protein product n=1 Tax=Ambrosiozyma monospora TaxID=43982 RepID=A0ACB5TGI3_AMBMO|nr:unnamed protein product [Ambrosiozyma monospora]
MSSSNGLFSNLPPSNAFDIGGFMGSFSGNKNNGIPKIISVANCKNGASLGVTATSTTNPPNNTNVPYSSGNTPLSIDAMLTTMSEPRHSKDL